MYSRTFALVGWTIIIVAVMRLAPVCSFQARLFVSRTAATKSYTRLWGKKVKRGKLAKNVSPGSSGSKRMKKKKESTSSSKNSSEPTAGISSSLTEWAASSQKAQNVDAPAEEVTPIVVDDVVEASAEGYTPFVSKTKPTSERRLKQSARKAQEAERDALLVQIVEKLEDMLKEKSGATLQDILGAVRQLMTLPQSGNLRLLMSGGQRYDYRLAWVGSDDALCHVGTGLHKVPLARMQEVFMSFKGKNRVELLEVISILGPFPNVRNTLQGDASVKLGEDVTYWQIAMDSMVDGTGKELLAGTEDNIRNVDLQVYFADASAIVAVVPPESGLRQDPLDQDGTNVLVFLREDDLESKLEAFRVNVI